MDYNSLVGVAIAVVGIVSGGLGFALRALYSKTSDNEKEINNHKIIVARDYITRNEITSITSQLDKRFDKFESWVGSKFDRLLEKDEKK